MWIQSVFSNFYSCKWQFGRLVKWGFTFKMDTHLIIDPDTTKKATQSVLKN